MTSPKTHKGFSLIELMIAITLGIILMGAAIQFFLSGKQTFEFNDNTSRIQENGRIALDILIEDIRRSGHKHPDELMRPDVIITQYPDPNNPSDMIDCDQGSYPLPCSQNNDAANSDVLSVQYWRPPSIATDCTGATIAGNQKIANIYSVQDIDGDGVNSLYCRGYSVTNATYLSNNTPLIDGIDNMQVLYRVESGGQYSYRSLNRLDRSALQNVNAIKIALLVSNGMQTGSAESKDRDYQVLDSGTISLQDDTHMRRIYSTTIHLPNGGTQE